MSEQTSKRPDNVYTPPEVASLALAEIRACRDPQARTISTGWASVDRIIRPLRPGKLMVVHAYTSNYKTGFMTWWARRLARNILETGGENDPGAVVYVSWEDTVEEMGVYDLAHATMINVNVLDDGRVTDEQMRELEGASMRRAALPLFVLGDTLGRGSKRPRMTMRHVENCLGWLREHVAFKPAAIFLDYLNLIAPEKASGWGDDNRRTDIMELTYRCRDLGVAHGCPVVLAAQSKRETNNRDWKAPQKYDVLESSAIEQFADIMISLWYPITSEPLGAAVRYLKDPDGRVTDLVIDEHLLILSVNKQKKGRAGGWFALHVEPERNELAPMNKRPKEEPSVELITTTRRRGGGGNGHEERMPF